MMRRSRRRPRRSRRPGSARARAAWHFGVRLEGRASAHRQARRQPRRANDVGEEDSCEHAVGHDRRSRPAQEALDLTCRVVVGPDGEVVAGCLDELRAGDKSSDLARRFELWRPSTRVGTRIAGRTSQMSVSYHIRQKAPAELGLAASRWKFANQARYRSIQGRVEGGHPVQERALAPTLADLAQVGGALVLAEIEAANCVVRTSAAVRSGRLPRTGRTSARPGERRRGQTARSRPHRVRRVRRPSAPQASAPLANGRKGQAPLVEQDQARKRGEALVERTPARLLPRRDQVADKGNENEVSRTPSDDLIRNRDLAAAGVVDIRCLH